MNFQEIVRTRRSIRRFKRSEIPDTKIMAILDSARWAPSYRNSQPWHLLVVNSPEDLEFISKLYLESYLKLADNLKNNEASAIRAIADMLKKEVSEASFTVIMIADPSRSISWPIDLSMASQNMMLMAHNLGIGSSFIDLTYSRMSSYFNKELMRERFNIPEGLVIFSMIVFGIPEEIPRPPQRKSLSEIIHYGRW
ncbi:MAG: nitroreductase family protein [Thermoplasmata archaeon]